MPDGACRDPGVLEAKWPKRWEPRKESEWKGRLSYWSGYYTSSLVTRVGKLRLRVPRDRHGRFATEIFERYQRSEKAQMYIQGVSTRIKAIAKTLRTQF